MLKSRNIFVVALLSLVAIVGVADAGTKVENDLSQCRAGSDGTAALVRVTGFRFNPTAAIAVGWSVVSGCIALIFPFNCTIAT